MIDKQLEASNIFITAEDIRISVLKVLELYFPDIEFSEDVRDKVDAAMADLFNPKNYKKHADLTNHSLYTNKRIGKICSSVTSKLSSHKKKHKPINDLFEKYELKKEAKHYKFRFFIKWLTLFTKYPVIITFYKEFFMKYMKSSDATIYEPVKTNKFNDALKEKFPEYKKLLGKLSEGSNDNDDVYGIREALCFIDIHGDNLD